MRALNAPDALRDDEFDNLMGQFAPFESEPNIALGISGGQDSITLFALLHSWCQKNNARLHCLIVNHRLRGEAQDEALKVQHYIKQQGARAIILERQEQTTPSSNIQEQARLMRYNLMGDYCRAHDILHLAIAHHRNDQAETFLMRLGRGSGVYGLAAMSAQHYTSFGRILRPLLTIGQERVHATCTQKNLPIIHDPSNHDERFLRTRLRTHKDTLKALNLARDNLVATAARLKRVRHLLEQQCAKHGAQIFSCSPYGFVTFAPASICTLDEEIALRLLGSALMTIGGQHVMPRMESLYTLYQSLPLEKTLTLHGCIIKKHKKCTVIMREPALIKEKYDLKDKGRILWDNRFVIEYHNPDCLPYHIECYGKKSHPDFAPAFTKDIPQEALMSLPALWNNHKKCLDILHGTCHYSSCALRIFFAPASMMTALS